ncbi:GNAT family N-acetyltransferase [Streptomyces sp. DH12]|uniref:GNAT family N-acetyltransferase n=1 Tax=Streptomyces sp. DH12 TaxID=2857010 RepID=UPI0027D287B3|nr:GNAT family N-acetyltransferase [Streptomyces sp. DH12]
MDTDRDTTASGGYARTDTHTGGGNGGDAGTAGHTAPGGDARTGERDIRIGPLTGDRVRAEAGGALSALLRDAVHHGASVGFLAPLEAAEAAAWWRRAAAEADTGARTIWAARGADGELLGVVSLVRAAPSNQRHRGDVSKLLVHTSARGRGVGRRLLAAVEAGAAEAGLTLLVLDTETGSPAEGLYRSAGWTRAGTVPGYATDPAGVPRATAYYYKALD